MTDRLKFVVPIPSSSKNSRVLTRSRSGRIRSLPSQRARRSKEQIQAAARLAIETHSDQTVFGPEAQIAVHVEHRVKSDEVVVEVVSLGPKPRGKTGRSHDLDNMASTILDALNGLAYGDDRQVALLQVERTYD